jgi:hypothetical protein
MIVKLPISNKNRILAVEIEHIDPPFTKTLKVKQLYLDKELTEINILFPEII